MDLLLSIQLKYHAEADLNRLAYKVAADDIMDRMFLAIVIITHGAGAIWY